jgi:hypothetical protein
MPPLWAEIPNSLPSAPWWVPEKPDAILGAIIGGMIAFLTAWLSNRNARKRQAQELSFSSSEKDKERLFALKRETYLPLIEATSAAFGYSVQIATLPSEQVRAQEPLMTMGRLIARLGLIAPKEVQVAVQKTHLQLTALVMKQIGERAVIDKISSDLATIDFEIQLRLDRQKALQQRQEKHIDGQTADADLMRHLFDEHQSASREIDDLIARKSPLIQKKTSAELASLENATSVIRSLVADATDALVAIRKDLGMATDETWIRQFSEETSKSYSSLVQQFLREVRAKAIE